jgi:hypothetical protein
MFIPHIGFGFFSIPDFGVKKAQDPGSGTLLGGSVDQWSQICSILIKSRIQNQILI